MLFLKESKSACLYYVGPLPCEVKPTQNSSTFQNNRDAVPTLARMFKSFVQMTNAFEDPEAVGSMMYAGIKASIGLEDQEALAEARLNCFEKEGGLFVKSAQVRAELAGGMYNQTTKEELKKTQMSDRTCVPFSDIEPKLRKASEAFEEHVLPLAEVVQEPLGAATIAQVHLLGEDKIVKVVLLENKTKIEKQYHRAQQNAETAGYFTSKSYKMIFVLIGLEYRLMMVEFDLEKESENMKQAREDLQSLQTQWPKVRQVNVPEVLGATKEVMVSQLVPGEHLSSILGDAEKPMEFKKDVLRTLFEYLGASMLLLGRVHCDPHPKNILVHVVDGEYVLYVLDFGRCVEFTTEEKEALVGIFSNLLPLKRQDEHHTNGEAVARCMKQLGLHTEQDSTDGLVAMALQIFDSADNGCASSCGMRLAEKGKLGLASDPAGLECLTIKVYSLMRMITLLGSFAEQVDDRELLNTACLWCPIADRALELEPAH